MIELPSGWRRIPLGDLGDWFGGGTPAKHRTEFWNNGTVPWLSPKDMGREVIQSTQDHITHAAVVGSSVRRVPEGSVAIVVRSGILERTLPIAVVPFEITLNQDMKALVPRSDVDARWVAWGLRSREQELLRRCRKSGTTVASIETKALMAQELPVPPLDQQRRIVEILEDHLSRLDAADDNFSAVERRLGSLRGGLLDCALDEAIANTSGGTRSSLDSLVAPGRKLAYGVLVPGPDVAGGVPFIRVGDLRAGHVRESELKRIAPDVSARFPRTVLSGGEVLLSLVGTIGRTGIVPDTLSGANVARAVGVLPLRNDVDPRFVSTLLEAPRSNRSLNDLAHEVARKTLNLEDVRRLELPVPPLDDQRRIVAGLEQGLSGIDRLQGIIGDARKRAAALRRSLLAAALSGRLVS